MKYAFELGSGAMMYITSFIMIGSGRVSGGPASGSGWPLRRVSISSWRGAAVNLLN
jgi:hypothetical protein